MPGLKVKYPAFLNVMVTICTSEATKGGVTWLFSFYSLYVCLRVVVRYFRPVFQLLVCFSCLFVFVSVFLLVI